MVKVVGVGVEISVSRRWLARVVCVLALFVLVGVFVLRGCAGLASAQGAVPLNGAFDWSWAGWSLYDGSPFCFWQAAGGHDGGDVYALGGTCRFISSPVTVGDSAVLSYWLNASQGVCRFWDFATNTGTDFSYHTVGDWTNYTVDLSSYSGESGVIDCKLANYDSLDTVTLSNSTNWLITAWENGAFPSSRNYWLGSGGWDGSLGYPAGSLSFSSSDNDIALISSAFTSWSGQYTFWLDVDSTGPYVQLCVSDLTVNTYTCFGNAVPPVAGWSGYSVDMTPFTGDAVVVKVLPFVGSGKHLWFDQFCSVAVGCPVGTYATPTPVLPTPTSAGPTSTPNYFPYGAGTPVPVSVPTIDWSQYPTTAPYPTFPAYPTQLPYPTQVYGEGTAQPVIINGGSPIPVYLTTPFPTQVNPTPIYGKDTPIPYYDASTVTPTPWIPTPASASGLVQVAGPSGQINFSDVQANSNLVLGSSSDTSNKIINLHIGQYDWTQAIGCGIGGLPVKLPLCQSFLFHFQYPDQILFAGIDLYPGLNALGLFWISMYVLIRLRKR